VLLGAVLLALLAAALAALPFVISFFIFRPEKLEITDPARWGLPGAHAVTFAASDGSALLGWWLPPSSGAAATVLVVHGRSGNISNRVGIARRLRSDGYGVLMFDYRGYGASQGSTSELAMSEDAISAYAWLLAQGVSPQRLIVIGQSLGNAPAAQLASHRPVGGLVLVSPFSNLPEAAADRLPWLPLGALP
jgi:alpha-beta hydrolase superfamily lysophospholipase